MSLFSALSVSASGMSAQRSRAELLVENLANAETTHTPDGGPYRRKDAVFQSADVSSSFADMFQVEMNPQSAGVEVSKIVVDQRDPEKRYMPGHPDADKDGDVVRFRASTLPRRWSTGSARREMMKAIRRDVGCQGDDRAFHRFIRAKRIRLEPTTSRVSRT